MSNWGPLPTSSGCPAFTYQGNPYWHYAPFVLHLPNGSFVAPDTFVAASGHQLLGPSCKCCASPLPTTVHRRFKYLTVISHRWSFAFYREFADLRRHFVVEVLPHIALFNALDNVATATVVLESHRPYVVDFMRILRTPFIVAEPNVTYHAEWLAIPSLPACGNPAPEGLAVLRRVILTRLGLDDLRVAARNASVLVIRRPKSRVLGNHDAMLEALRRRFPEERFLDVPLESLPVRRQISFVATAKVIVGVHGAGLSHMIFCPARSPVIELRLRESPNACFCALARALDRPYLGLSLAQRTGPAGGLNVSIPEMLQAFERALVVAESGRAIARRNDTTHLPPIFQPR